MNTHSDATFSTAPVHRSARPPVRRGFGVLMLVEAASLAVAGVLHLGARIPLGFTTVHEVTQAGAGGPELVIAAVLALAAVLVLGRPARARIAALSATWFAAAGTVLGLSITATGDSAARTPNVIYHVCLLAVLVTGLIALYRDTSATR